MEYDLSKFVPDDGVDIPGQGRFIPDPPPRGIARRVADTVGIPLAKGIIGVPEALTGLADIPTGGAVGKAVESAGVRFKDAKAALDEMLSPEQQAINQGLQDTKGFLPTVGYALQNPSTILGAAVESAPSMLGGAAIGRGAVALAPKLSPLAAGAIGEGAVSAGQGAEQVRQESPSGDLTAGQSALAAGSGALTGLIGGAGGKLAAKMGLTDIDTALVRGSLAPAGKTGIGAAVKRVTGGVVSEGLIEELPQSAQEQIAQNLALGKPWAEGVAEAAAMGALVGGVMGGGANVFAGQQAPAPIPDQSGAAPNPGNVPETTAPVTGVGSENTQQNQPVVGQANGNEPIPVTAPIQRDETGASVHPYDAAALNAALAPNAGPLTKAAGIAAAPIPDGPPTATEQARLDASLQGTMQDTVKQERQAQQQIEQADERVRVQQEKATEAQRRTMLDAILEDQDIRNPVGAFAAAVKRAGYTGELAVPSKEELGRIKKFQDVQAAIEQEHVDAGTAAGTPNEMDVSALVKERAPAKSSGGSAKADTQAAAPSLPAELLPAAHAAKAMKKDGPTAFFQAVKKFAPAGPKRLELMAAFKAFVPAPDQQAKAAPASAQPSGSPVRSSTSATPAAALSQSAQTRLAQSTSAARVQPPDVSVARAPSTPAAKLPPQTQTADASARAEGNTVPPVSSPAPDSARQAESAKPAAKPVSPEAAPSPRPVPSPSASSSPVAKRESVAQKQRGGTPLTEQENRANSLAATASELSGQIHEESSQADFDPKDIPQVIQHWMKNNVYSFTEQEVRDALIADIEKRPAFRRKAGVLAALRTSPPQPANAAATPPAAKSTAVHDARAVLAQSKGQLNAMQLRILQTAINEGAKVENGTAPLTPGYAKKLREIADSVAAFKPAAGDAVRALADHVDSVRPKSQMEQNRATKEQAKAEKKAANKAAMEARREAATKAKAPAPAGSQRIMNVDSVLEATRNIGGIRYEVFKAANGNELRASLRVTDIDSGNVVSLVQFQSLAEAEAKFNETSRAALKAETPASAAPEPSAADAAKVSAEDFDKLIDEVFAEPPAPPVATKALMIPTRQGVMVQPVDDLGNHVGEAHMAGEKPKDEPAPPKPAGEFEKGDRVELIDGQYAGRHGAISEKTALRTVSIFGGGSTSERSVHYHVKTDAGVEVYAGPDQIKAETAKPENVTPDIQMNGMWQDPAAVLRSVEYSRSNANKSRGAAGRARLDQSKKQHLAQAADYDKRATETQAAFDAWAAKYPESAAPLLPKKTVLKAPATTTGTADIPAMTMAQQKHGKTGEQIYIVNMNERQERPVFERMRDRAVSMGGYYSNYAGARGFTFKTEEAARRFMGQGEAPAGDAKIIKDFLAGGRDAVLPETKTGGQILGEAAGHAGGAIKAGFAGLDALFGRKGTLGSGPVFDESTWAQAKPHFQAAYAEFVAAGKSLRDFVVHIREAYNDAIIPYLKRWHQELSQEAQNGSPTDTQATGNDDQPGDGGQRPRSVLQPEGKRETAGGDRATGADVRNDDEPSPQPGADQVDSGRPDQPTGAGSGAGAGSTGSKRGGTGGRARIPAKRKPGLPAGISDYRPAPGSITRTGGWKKQAGVNLDIIELVKKLETENRLATPEEQSILAQWTGWGAGELAQNLFKGYQSGDGFNFDLYRQDDWLSLRKRAAELMTPQEAADAARSTQYAHYTSEPVIRSMWDAIRRMGFAGGRIFEPGMGTGLFSVYGPDDILKNSVYTGIEFEPFTAKIAKYLLPEQNVINGDYTQYKAPPAFFDVAAGNPPFAKTAILNDPEYRKYRFSLHDYMFAKTIDRIRPGGIMAFVTSAYTMDKATDTARKYLAERADLVGAIRLPRTAFQQNAGTEVVTDILFFQRRAPGQEQAGQKWQNLKSIDVAGEPYLINEYFADHPEMVLGEHSRAGKMYAANQYTVLPSNGELSDQLAAAVAKLPENIYTAAKMADKTKRDAFERDMNPKAVKEGQLYVGDDGELYRREFGTGRRLEDVRKSGAAEKAWFKGYVGLRDALKQARYDQMTDGEWEKSLKALNKAYDKFVKEHGNLLVYTENDVVDTDEDGNERTITERRYKNESRFRIDSEGALVAALERIDQAGAIKKGPFLVDRVLAKPVTPKVDTIHDALAVSLSDTGRLDLGDIAGRLSKDVEDVITELGDLIYYAPAGEWKLADEYLSGNVVQKLEEAQAAAAVDKAYERNVQALMKAQPKPLSAADITVGLGSSWIPVQYFNEFAESVLGIRGASLSRDVLGQWQGMEGAGVQSGRRVGDWSTLARSARELFDAAMNSRSIKVTYTVDKKTVTDAEASAAANEKVRKMREEFGRWIWQDSKRAGDLLDLYNHQYNNIADRVFDGSHLQLPGLSLRYTLYPHQKRAIWRIIQTGTSYLAHAVGAGKTLEMIVSAMEQRRLGLIKTPMFAVPRHMLNQFAAEFLDAYPGADVMVASPENFHKENRKRFVAQAAMNKPDAIVISHPAFGLIKPDPKMTQQVLDDLIGELQAAMSDLDERDQKDKRTRKQIEQRIEQLEQRFLSKTSAGDDLVTLEEMGVDFLYVDEAHEFRKLDFVTNRQNVKGITPEGSRRALDLYIKTKALAQNRPGRSHVFASGTPITNTLAEIYTIQRYMDEAALGVDGFASFDDWAAQFGNVESYDERNASGSYEVVERFASLINVPELMSRVRSFMDVLTFGQLKHLLTVPEMQGGAPQIVLSEITPALKEYMKSLEARIAISRKWKPSKEQPGNPDPLINIITDARLASIDTAFVMGGVSNPGSKLNKMIDAIIAAHKKHAKNTYTTEGKEDPIKGATQIVFSAVGFGEQVAKNRGFDVRGYIERRLIKGGVKAGEIAWMNDYSSPVQKEAMFRAMREGKVRILFGSPKNMGTGVNVQKRLRAEHYLSPPWYPADEEQPRGRIVRQGNQNAVVDLGWYATKETYDSTQWQMISRKQRFIERAMTGSRDVRKLDDISEASQYEQASALASGDERVIKFSRLKRDIESLETLNRAHADEQSNLRSNARWAQSSIKSLNESIAKLEQAIADGAGNYLRSSDTKGEIAGKQVKSAGELGQAVLDEVRRKLKETPPTDEKAPVRFSLGTLNGAEVRGELEMRENKKQIDFHADIWLRWGKYNGRSTRLLPMADYSTQEAVGVGSALLDAHGKVQQELNSDERELDQQKARLADYEKHIGAPFERMNELTEKIAEAAVLRGELMNTNAQPAPAQVEIEATAIETGAWEDEGGRALGNRNANTIRPGKPLDRTLYSMVNQGATAPELLAHIAQHSKTPLNRAIAHLLIRVKINPTVIMGAIDPSYKFATGNDHGYSASYVPEKDLVTLHSFGKVEQDLVHEFMHSATVAALRRKGMAAVQMKALFKHVEKFIADHPELQGQYGMERIEEFVSEAFSNPKFQEMLKGIPARAGGPVRSAWEWFANIVRSILGLHQSQSNAFLQALEIGGALVEENMAAKGVAGEALGNRAQQFTDAFKRWFAGSKVVDKDGKPLVVYHGTYIDFNNFQPSDGGTFGDGIYLARDPGEASIYAGMEPSDTGGRVLPVYVSIINPASEELAGEVEAEFGGGTSAELKRRGFDGIFAGDTIVAFSPEQIKSATGNSGVFDPNNPSILGNRADPSGTFSPYKDAAINAVRDVFTNNKTFSTANLGMLPGLATSKQKAFVDPENFGPVHNAVQSYLSSVSKYALRAANLAPDVLQQITSVHDAIKAIGKLAHRKQTTKDMAALSKALNREREIKHRLTDADPEWDTLTDTQHSLLAQSHDVLDKSMRDLNAASIARTLHGKHIDAAVADMMETGDVGPMLDTLKTRIENTDDPQIKADLQDAYKVSKERTDKIESLITKGYVPHLRFGDWAVDVIDPAGNRRSFNFFESQRQANAAVRAFKDEFPTHEVSVSKVSKESPTLFEGVSPDVLELFVDQLAAKGIVDAKESEAYQEFLKQVVANNSAMKRLIHSKEIPGYDTDIQQVLASFTTANARMASILTHGPSIVQAIGNIDKRTHAESYDEAIKLRDYILNPTEEFAKLRSYLFINYLGGSIASAMTNMTQPVMTTFPRLSEFAGMKAATYIKDGAKIATGRIFKGMPMPAGELRNAIERGEKEGLLLPQEMHQLYAESIKGLGSGVGARATMQLLGSFFSVSEQFNRELTFVAAFKTAQGMTAEQLKAAGARDGAVVDDAYSFARMVTEDAQFLYNKGNRPTFSRGLGAPLFVFKMYSIQYLELLKRLPPKQRLLALGLLVLAAGANGLPFSDDLDDLISTVAQSLGYDWNVKQAKRALAYKAFGKTMGDFVLHGASTFTPLDVSQRLGLANIVPGTGMFKQSNTDKADDILEWFGAAGSMARSFTYSIANAQDGRYADALKAPLPLFMQNIAKGMQMWETGEYRSGAGKKVMDVDKVDAIVKAIGFQPREVADVMRTDREIRETVDLVRNTQSAIMRKIVASVVDNDPEARMAAFAELQQWNRDNPDSKIRILPNSIQQAVRNARMTLQQRTLKQASPSIRGGIAALQ